MKRWQVCFLLFLGLYLPTLVAQASHIHSTRAQQSLEELIGGSGRIEVISVQGRAAPPVSDAGRGRIYFDSGTNTFQVSQNAGAYVTLVGAGGSAPANATYITQTAHAGLSAEQALSSLSSGIMRVATTTGAITSLTDSAGIAANVSDETGIGGVLVFNAAPTFTTSITDPLVIGGTGTTSTLILRSTSGVGAAGADIIFQTGDNGSITVARAFTTNGGQFGLIQGIASFPALTSIGARSTGLFFVDAPPSLGFAVDSLEVMRLVGTNVGIRTATFGTSAANTLAQLIGTVPSTSPADVFQTTIIDSAGAGTASWQGRDEQGFTYTLGNAMFLLGGTTSSFPALKRSAAIMEVRLADDSAYAALTTGAISSNSTIKSTATSDLGWVVQNAANQACNTTCTVGACVVGLDTAAVGNFLACTDATADTCLCAG